MVEIERVARGWRLLAGLVVMAAAMPAALPGPNCLAKLQQKPATFGNAAVLIGVSQPRLFEGLRPLPGAASDVSRLWEALEGSGAYKGNVYTLVDGEATTAAVRECLTGVGRLAGQGSTVVVYVSARGFASDAAPEGFIVTADAALDKLTGAASKAKGGNGLTTSELHEAVGRMRKASSRFLFLDLCRDPEEMPGIPNQINSRILDQRFYDGSGTRQIVTASFGSDRSLESHFAKALVGVLRTGKLEFGPLFETLRDGVWAASGKKQKPARPKTEGNGPLSGCLLCPRATQGALLASAAPMFVAAEEGADSAEWVKNRMDAVRAEEDGQRVFVRYGEGNHFPGDPLQQCKTGTRVPGDFQLCKEEFAFAAKRFAEAVRLYKLAPAGEAADERVIASLEERERFSRAEALLLAGDAAGAQTVLGKPEAFGFAESHNLLGISYLEQEPAKYPEAEAQFALAIKKAPYWGYPRHNLALALVEHGGYTEAERAYREAITMTPIGEMFTDKTNACFAGRNRLISARPYLYYNLGVLLQRVNRLGEAQKAFCLAEASFQLRLSSLENAVGLDGKRAEAARINLADVKNSEGVLFQMRGKRGQAEKQFKQALSWNDQLLAARFNLARLKEKKEPEEAKKLYAKIQADAARQGGRELTSVAAEKAAAELRLASLFNLARSKQKDNRAEAKRLYEDIVADAACQGSGELTTCVAAKKALAALR